MERGHDAAGCTSNIIKNISIQNSSFQLQLENCQATIFCVVITTSKITIQTFCNTYTTIHPQALLIIPPLSPCDSTRFPVEMRILARGSARLAEPSLALLLTSRAEPRFQNHEPSLDFNSTSRAWISNFTGRAASRLVEYFSFFLIKLVFKLQTGFFFACGELFFNNSF